MDVHPFCLILPDMAEKEYADLLADIKANGLRDPITSYNGMILDGRHRWRACKDAGVPERVVPFVGDDAAALAFVKSREMRRNLNATQRAWIAREFMDREHALARKRQAQAGGNRKALPETLPEAPPSKGDARDKAGAAMGVSGKMVSDAVRVAKTASPPLVQAIKAGAIHMDEALTISTLGRQSQKRLVAIENKTARKHATACAQNASRGKRKVPPRAVNEPATPFVRAFINQVARAGIYTREEGCPDASTAIARLCAEMDWSHPGLLAMLERCAYTATIVVALCQHQAKRVA